LAPNCDRAKILDTIHAVMTKAKIMEAFQDLDSEESAQTGHPPKKESAWTVLAPILQFLFEIQNA
jgi:hypothetical protein